MDRIALGLSCSRASLHHLTTSIVAAPSTWPRQRNRAALFTYRRRSRNGLEHTSPSDYTQHPPVHRRIQQVRKRHRRPRRGDPPLGTRERIAGRALGVSKGTQPAAYPSSVRASATIAETTTAPLPPIWASIAPAAALRACVRRRRLAPASATGPTGLESWSPSCLPFSSSFGFLLFTNQFVSPPFTRR